MNKILKYFLYSFIYLYNFSLFSLISEKLLENNFKLLSKKNLECKEIFNKYIIEKNVAVLIYNIKEIHKLIQDTLAEADIAKISKTEIHKKLYNQISSEFKLKKSCTSQCNANSALISWMLEIINKMATENDCTALWDCIEDIALTQTSKSKQIIYDMANQLKIMHEKSFPIVPSFRYCAAILELEIEVEKAFPQIVINYLYSQEKKATIQTRKESLYSKRSSKAHEDKKESLFVHYDFLTNISQPNIEIAIIGRSGWNKSTVELILKTDALFDSKTYRFKRPLLIVTPYFNAYKDRLATDLKMSDLITLTLRERLRDQAFSELPLRIFPVFIPHISEDPDISSIAIFLGNGSNKIMISNGGPDFTYQALHDEPDVKGTNVYERYFSIAGKKMPYIAEAVAYQTFINQDIKGEPSLFWSLLQNPLFLTGGVDISSGANLYYRISKMRDNTSSIFTSLERISIMRKTHHFIYSIGLGAVADTEIHKLNISTLNKGFLALPPHSIALFTYHIQGELAPECNGVVI